MNVSGMIAALERIRAKHGDVEVWAFNSFEEFGPAVVAEPDDDDGYCVVYHTTADA